MLAVAEALGISVDTLAFVAQRFAGHVSMIDAAEPARRAELERLVARDFDELATAYKAVKRVVERMPKA
jgi:hypothetical protein